MAGCSPDTGGVNPLLTVPKLNREDENGFALLSLSGAKTDKIVKLMKLTQQEMRIDEWLF